MADLKVRVGVDGTGFNAGMNAIERRARQASVNINRNLATTIGRSFALGAGASAAKGLLDFAGKFEDMAKASGTTAEHMQAIAYAAKQSSSDVEGFALAMKNLASARSDALKNPDGEKAKAFGALGIGGGELRQLSDMGALLFRVSDGVKAVNLDANSLPVILSLIGAKNMTVLPAMKSGLRDAADEAERLNLIMGRGTTSTLDSVGDKLGTVGAGLRKIGADILVLVVKPFTTLYTAIMQIPAAFELLGGNINLATTKLEKALGMAGADARIKEAQDRIKFAKGELDRLSNEHADIYDFNKPKKGGVAIQSPEEEKAIEKVLKEKAESEASFSGPAGSPFGMSADSATKIGGFIGGTNPGIIADILGRQQLAAQQQIARNTAELLAWMRSRNFTLDDEGSL